MIRQLVERHRAWSPTRSLVFAAPVFMGYYANTGSSWIAQ
jgi:hypothetical protein